MAFCAVQPLGEDLSKMMERKLIVCMGLILCNIGGAYGTFSYQNSSLLETALLTNYYASVRPSETVTVQLDLGIFHINTLEMVDQRLSLIGFLVARWDDSRLAWNTASYGDIAETFLKSSQIWVPPLTLANPADGIKFLSDDSDVASLPIKISNTGVVVWLAQANFDVYCPVDITFYPFDSQECNILITSWMFESDQILLQQTNSDVINTDLFEKHGEWELAKSEIENGSRTLHNHPTSKVTFKLYLNRKYSYYILTMILPNVFLAFLACLVFYNPTETDEGGKTDMSLTVLLSLAVLITGVSANIPTTSLHISILNVYLLCTLAMTSFQVLIVQVLMQWNYYYDNGYQPSPFLQTVAKLTGRIVRYSSNRTGDDSMVVRTMENNINNISSTDDNKDHKVFLMDTEGEISVKRTNGHCNTDSPVAWEKGNPVRSESPVEELYTYRDLTRIMDIFLFYFFLFLTTIMTLVFLLVLAFGDTRY